MLVITFRCLVLSVLFLQIPLIAMAEEIKGKDNQTKKGTIILGLITRHVNPSDDTNESTKMLGFTYSDWGMIGFKNSYGDQSFFGGRRFQTKEHHHPRNGNFFIQGNLYAGLLQGYGDRFPNIKGVTVVAMPTVGFGYKNAVIEILYVPTPSGGVFTSLLTYRI